MDGKLSFNTDKTKVWLLLMYIPYISIVFAVLASVKYVDKSYMRFHCRQSIILFLFLVLSLFILLITYSFGIFLTMVLYLIHLIMIVSVVTDVDLKVPFVRNLAEKIPDFYLYKLLTGKDPSENWE